MVKHWFLSALTVLMMAHVASAEDVDVKALARLVAGKGLASVNVGDYKGSCLVHAISDFALATGDASDMALARDLIAGFADGRVIPDPGNSFLSYDYGGSGAALLAWKGDGAMAPQVLEGAAVSWEKQLRNAAGVMIPKYYSLEKDPIFVDIAFAVTPFFLYSGLLAKDSRYVDFSVDEAMKVYYTLRDSATGLMHQGRGVMALPKGVISEDNWSRGNGWMSMAFTALMRDLPKGHPRRREVVRAARDFYLSCIAAQDSDCLWHQEMSDHSSFVEISGSALLLAGVGAAIETGVLPRKYLPRFEAGLKSLLGYVDADGSVGHVCMSNLTPGDGSKEALKLRHYYFNEPHGFGPVVFALGEAVRLGFGTVSLDGRLGASNALERPRAYVRFVEERKEDIAWENDRAAFRVYSRLIADKTMSGVDFWTKSVDYPVVDKWYAKELAGGSYHIDDGQGCDFYVVGRNRGMGGSAVLADGALAAPQTYANYRILSDDSAHIAFVLEYQPFSAAGRTIYDRKRIEMVPGTNFYKVTETVETEDGEDAVLAVGLTTFGNETMSVWRDRGVVSVSETVRLPDDTVLYDLDNNLDHSPRVHSSIVADPSAVSDFVKMGDDVIALIPVKSGVPAVYFVGCGWSGQMCGGGLRGNDQNWSAIVGTTSFGGLCELYSSK